MSGRPLADAAQLGERSIVERGDLFLVVSDAFLTETGVLADVVLPAALWGEKTGTFTNADRTVHLSEQAVEPPGHTRADMDIFIDFAARLDLRDKDGEPLVKWSTPEECFEAWKRCSKGRPLPSSAAIPRRRNTKRPPAELAAHAEELTELARC